MNWLHSFLSKFHHTEDEVSAEIKEIIQHIEDEFKALEARIAVLEIHTHSVLNSPVLASEPITAVPVA